MNEPKRMIRYWHRQSKYSCHQTHRQQSCATIIDVTECPKCGAPEGFFCTMMGTRTLIASQIHQDRVRLYNKTST